MSIIDKFFDLGNKVTGGDPVRKANFDYYMLWIMFIAFLTILIGNLWDFYKFQKLANLGWSLVMFAILWFQYNSLKGVREMRKMIKKPEKQELIEESVDEMLMEFK